MARNLLRTALDAPSADFRPGQWECIKALLRKKRLLVVQRTGWGKSMVYFLATRLLRDAGEGFTLLISPLLALMRNQIQAAARIGIKAESINSTNPEEWKAVQKKLLNNQVDILLISPERLANHDFRETVLVPVGGGIEKRRRPRRKVYSPCGGRMRPSGNPDRFRRCTRGGPDRHVSGSGGRRDRCGHSG